MSRAELGEGDLLARRYLLIERIADGGMSVVWRAFDQLLHRAVAVKLLDGPLSADRDVMRREARAAARLIHPDVIEVYDYGETVTPGGRLAAYVVMRLLDGSLLADRIAEGPLPWGEAAAIGQRLARVLAAAHEQGIVHRDVTPGNVLLTAEGAKLLDFGIAAFVGEPYEEELAGTPPYVAPERFQGVAADPSVDVYALGVLLYEMLTGRLPYPETTWEGLEAARHHGPPPAPEGAPAELRALCRACLSPDPGLRPRAQQVADALAVSGRRRRFRTRRFVWRVTAAAGLLAVWGGSLWLLSARPDGVTAQPTPAPVATSAPEDGPAPAARPDPGEATAPVGPDTGGPAEAPDTSGPMEVPDTGGPTVAPDTGRPAPTGGPETGEPSASSTARPREPVSQRQRPPSVEEAVERFDAALDSGLASASIRSDVALDLRQVLRNLVTSSAPDLSVVRTKLRDRQREGTLASDLVTVLDRHLTAVETALRAA